MPTSLVSFPPTSGPPGTQVIIHGTTFLNNVDCVSFNGVAVGPVFVDSDQDAAAAVPAAATTGPVSVHTVTNGWIASGDTFTVTQ